MNKLITYLLVIFIAASCTTLEVEKSPLPDVSLLSPDSIKTELGIFQILVDENDFADMIAKPREYITSPSLLNYWNSDNQSIFTNVSGSLEIKGVSSSYNDMKSLGIIFDQIFDNLATPILSPKKILPQHSLNYLEAIRFRNSGNDFGTTMIKDISYTEFALAANLNIELMYYRPVHVFVNNDYYGLLNLRTENEQHGMAGLVEQPLDSITVMKVDADNENLEWDQGPEEIASLFRATLKAEDAEAIWPLIDEASFIDYIVFQDYIGNNDWPENNGRMYSVSGGPFRFILFDTDYAAYKNKNAILPEMEYQNDDLSKLYRLMRQKSGFDDRLKERQEQLYKIFSPNLFSSLVDKNSKAIEKEIAYLMSLYGKPFSYFEWYFQLDILKREFEQRDKHIRKKYKL